MKILIDTLKKNMLSVVCGAIAILAMVALIYPLGGWFNELRTKVESRKTEYVALDGLAKKSRTLPIVDATQIEAKKLDVFPTLPVIERGKVVTGELVSQAASVAEAADKLNAHPLLVPGSLPAGQTSHAIQYQYAYQKQVEYLSTDETIRKQTLPFRLLDAGLIPTEQDIAAAKVARADEIRNSKLVPGPNGNQQQVDAEIALMQSTLADEMKQEIASKYKMYIRSDSLDVYPGVYNTPTPPVASTIYYSQIGLWVMEDVFKGIAEANKSSSNVLESPVKDLIKIDVAEDEGKTNAAYNGNSAGSVLGNYQPPPGFSSAQAPPPTDPAAAAIPLNLTGRMTNTTYSVIPFHLVIAVDAQRIPMVLADLSRNQFVTVLRCDVSPVDSPTAMLGGYSYGAVPIALLTIDGECLLLKSWLTKYVPPLLAAAPAAAAAPNAAGAPPGLLRPGSSEP